MAIWGWNPAIARINENRPGMSPIDQLGQNPTPAQTGSAALADSRQPTPSQPDLLQGFLQQLQGMLGQPEEQLKPPGPITWQEQLQLAAQAPYNPTAGPDFALKRAEENRAIANQNVQIRNRARQQKIDDLRQLASTAAMMPLRNAQTDLARARTEALLNPAAGDDKVMIQVTRQAPDGRKFSQWVPRGVARQMYMQGEPLEVMSSLPALRNFQSSEGLGQVNPYTGATSFLGGGSGQGGRLYAPLTPGMATTGMQNVETLAAGAGLKGAWLQARKELGIDANSGVWDALRYSLSDRMSRTQFLRNPGAFAKDIGFDPQAVLRYRSNLARGLNAYIKAQTGAQFSVQELEKYQQQFPLPMDDEQTFDTQLQQILEPAIQRLNDIMRLYGGAAGLLKAAQANPEIANIVDINDLSRSITLKSSAVLAPYSQVPAQTKTLSNGKRAVLINGQWKIEE